MPAHLKLPNEISTDVELKTIYSIFIFLSKWWCFPTETFPV